MRNRIFSVVLIVLSVMFLLAGCPAGTSPSQETVATPVITLGAGTYANPTSTFITTTTSGATIHYTITGITPIEESPTYSGSVAINHSLTLKAYAVKQGCIDSAVASATYTITNQKLDTPTFYPAAGTYDTAQTVSISSSYTKNGTPEIYYTTDGTTPTTASNKIYSGDTISVSKGMTLKAFAIRSGYTNSDIASATYTIANSKVATPVISTSSRATTTNPTITCSETQHVYITCATEGADIYYTTNGDTPTTSSTKYSDYFSVSSKTTVKAIAIKTGMDNSDVTSCQFVFRTAIPKVTTLPGVYSGSVSVELRNSSSFSDVVIHYTTDGSIPTSSSNTYSTPFPITTTTDVKFMATRKGFIDSPFNIAHYIIVPAGNIAEPLITPYGGPMLLGTDEITMISADGADIYYTTDGSAPTSGSIHYTGSFKLNGAATVKAIAIKGGKTSGVATTSFVAHQPETSLCGTWVDGASYTIVREHTMISEKYEYEYRTAPSLGYFVLSYPGSDSEKLSYDSSEDTFTYYYDTFTRKYGTTGSLTGYWVNSSSAGYLQGFCLDGSGHAFLQFYNGTVGGTYKMNGTDCTFLYSNMQTMYGLLLRDFLSSVAQKQ